MIAKLTDFLFPEQPEPLRNRHALLKERIESSPIEETNDDDDLRPFPGLPRLKHRRYVDKFRRAISDVATTGVPCTLHLPDEDDVTWEVQIESHGNGEIGVGWSHLDDWKRGENP